MDVVLTNLSNGLYEASRHRLNASAKKFGIGKLRSYDFEEIRTTAFYHDNRTILDHPTGMGYWLWKPYIIQEALNSLADGDIVIYADSGLEIIAPLDPLLDICRNDHPILLFGNGSLVNAAWTKRDCFIYMECDEPYYWYSPQCDAAFCLFRRCELTLRFVSEWLERCRDPRILTDDTNISGRRNLPGFVEHRRDQSVLSLLAAKYRISLFRMPTQFGNHYKLPALREHGEFNCIDQRHQEQVEQYAVIPYYNSFFGQLLNHHRSSKAGTPAAARKSSIFRLLPRAVSKRYTWWRDSIALKKELLKRSAEH